MSSTPVKIISFETGPNTEEPVILHHVIMGLKKPGAHSLVEIVVELGEGATQNRFTEEPLDSRDEMIRYLHGTWRTMKSHVPSGTRSWLCFYSGTSVEQAVSDAEEYLYERFMEQMQNI